MSYIYFIQADSGPIKIGYSAQKYVKNRLIALQTCNYEKLTLLCTMSGTKDTERELHEQFKDFLIRGEWFQSNEKLLELIHTLPYLGITSEWDTCGNKHSRWAGENVPKQLKYDRIKRKFTLGPCIKCRKQGHDYHFVDGNRDNLSSENIVSYCRSCTMKEDGRSDNLKKLSKQLSEKRTLNKKTICDNCKISCSNIRRGRCKNCYRYFISNDCERPIDKLDENRLLKTGPRPKDPQKCINCPKMEIIRLKSGKCHACDTFFRRNKCDRKL